MISPPMKRVKLSTQRLSESEGLSIMRPYRQVYLVNVGVNHTHKLRSPIFPDKRFEFIPIHEKTHVNECVQTAIQPITYDHLYCHNTPRKLLSLFPEKLQNQY